MTTDLFFPNTPIYGIPRPDRLYRQFAFRQQPSEIDQGKVRDILLDYGLFLLTPAVAPAGPGRSDTLVLETTDGVKLLKRYKSNLDAAAIRHEHSILRHLARVYFPAPRLTFTTSDDTFIQREDRIYALFDYFDGYFQYHNYFFLPAATRQFVAASGRALGLLHAVLKDFDPEGQNPNGFKSRQGERWRELDWFTEKLAWCKTKLPDLPNEAARELDGMMSKHSAWIESRLRELDVYLRAADPTRLIIHGDYGPYNLFFKQDRPVIILDFELARLDWRLSDLANALPSFARSRLGFNYTRMADFLGAYQSVFPIDQQELQLLPDVWLFLTLRRVIVCWHRYCETQAQGWLDEARQKLALAHWLIDQRIRLSELMLSLSTISMQRHRL
ncbi:MAG: hypothetical protein EHM70_00735 [Chloroflexota bacterium]|nr:MAG: hypothetical protein EHM70_00735 [Chloroflexota bacterium]